MYLSCRDLVPIIGALENNTWFTKFTASKIKLVSPQWEKIVRIDCFLKVIYITYLTLNMIKQIVYNPQKKHATSNIALDICMLTEIIVFVTTAIV